MINKLYGSIIIFFYFLKWPIVIYVSILWFYLEQDVSIALLLLALVSIVLIIKDIISFLKRSKST
jgi:hypothetical protein